MTSFIDYLKEDPGCLYIYNRDFSIYGLNEKERYTIVVTDNWVCPEDWIGFDTSVYEIYNLQQWFNFVTSGSIIGWECACLNKKYIIKEHVKLLMKTDPLQLRKDVDQLYVKYKVYSGIDSNLYFELIRQIRFAVQIINNHKILNFKDGLDTCRAILKCESVSEIDKIITNEYQVLKKLTDGVFKQDILNRAKKNGNL